MFVNFTWKVPVTWPAKVTNMKMKPPMTGAGMQYFASAGIFFLT